MKAGFYLGALLAGFAFTVGNATGRYTAAQEYAPRLIAHDCQLAGGDLWAMEESDFPTPCRNIEKWRP